MPTTVASETANGEDFILTNGAEMQAPQIPGTLPAADIKRLKLDAFDRSNDLKPLSEVHRRHHCQECLRMEQGY